MKVAYSLINTDGEFSVGIYTSLKKCYGALKYTVHDIFEEGYSSKEEIKEWYEIRRVFLNSEPLTCFEFSQCGDKIPINWEKVFDK